jgi:hypothetical protein
MSNPATDISRDWLGTVQTRLLAWWMPKAAIPESFRAVIWIVALIWMGTECSMRGGAIALTAATPALAISP